MAVDQPPSLLWCFSSRPRDTFFADRYSKTPEADMLDATFIRKFAEDWIASWNSHDLERILSHYTEDFEMVSPLIVERMKERSGRLRGKSAIRPYWTLGLVSSPPLHFELLGVSAGVDSIAISYRRTNGRTAVEVLTFDDRRVVVRGVAHYE
jgi:hypothetical protein